MPSANQYYKEAIALSAMFQSARIVDDIAQRGTFSTNAFETSIASIFKLSSPSVEDIYNGQVNFIPGLSDGFQCFKQMLEQRQPENANILRYVLGLIHLESKLKHNNELLSVLRTRLEQIQKKLAHFEMTHECIIAELAGIYEDTLGTFRYRIQVSGNRLYLENPANVNRIRAILLAGVRATLLWRQVGGKRWHLFLYRKQLAEVTGSLV